MRKAGNTHPSTASVMQRLQYVLEKLGKDVESESMLRSMIEIGNDSSVIFDGSAITAMGRFEKNVYEQGKYEESESLLRSIVKIQERSFGIEHKYTMHLMSNLAVTLSKQCKYTDTTVLLHILVQRKRKSLGAQHKSMVKSLEFLWWALQELREKQAQSHPDKRIHRSRSLASLSKAAPDPLLTA